MLAEVLALRREWYQRLARRETETERYMQMLDDPPAPFDDLRRVDAHRIPKIKKRFLRLNESA